MKVHAKISRVRQWLRWFATQYPQKCAYCNKAIDHEAFLIGDAGDGITIHHKDENRENNSPENLVLLHRSCHVRHHRLAPKSLETAST